MPNQMEYLFSFLKENPEHKTVYFNEQGGWVFSKNDRHPIEKSSKEILKGEKKYYEENPTDGDDVDVTDYLTSLETENKNLTDENQRLIEENDAMKTVIDELTKEVENLKA